MHWAGWETQVDRTGVGRQDVRELSMEHDEIAALWEEHRSARWPRLSSPNEGELMTLDTVISGCVVYYLDTAEGLDKPRVNILRDCLADLNGLLPDLTEDVSPYFERLRLLAELLLRPYTAG